MHIHLSHYSSSLIYFFSSSFPWNSFLFLSCVPVFMYPCPLHMLFPLQAITFPPSQASSTCFVLAVIVLCVLVLSAWFLLWEHLQHGIVDIYLLICPPPDCDFCLGTADASIWYTVIYLKVFWWLIRETNWLRTMGEFSLFCSYLSQSSILYFSPFPNHFLKLVPSTWNYHTHNLQT